MDNHDDEEDSNNLSNDLQYRHKNDVESDYVPGKYDNDEGIIGSWEAEYAAIDKEEGMVVTNDEIVERKEENQVNMDKVNHNTGLTMAMMKKEWRWIMRSHSHRMTQTMTDNRLRSHSEIDQ